MAVRAQRGITPQGAFGALALRAVAPAVPATRKMAPATVEIYRVDTAVRSAGEAEAIREASPLHILEAVERYRTELASGLYLLCENDHCTNIEITDGATTTVNIKRRYGPTSFFVVDGDSNALVEDYGFEVARP